MSFKYYTDQELPPMPITWRDRDGNVRDFSTGYTFTVKLALKTAPTVVVLTKSSGITGSASEPNYLVDWSTTDWSGLSHSATGVDYLVYAYARRTADSKDACFSAGSPPELTLITAAAVPS